MSNEFIVKFRPFDKVECCFDIVSVFVKRSFYAACNSIFSHSHDTIEIAILTLQETYVVYQCCYMLHSLHTPISGRFVIYRLGLV